jgi:DHA2 family multidrug resistance protein
VPAVGMALRDMPDALLKDASGLNTLMRNLGGAVGIAVVNTWLIGFTQSHGAGLGDALGQGASAIDAITGMAQMLGASGVAPAQALQMAAQTLAGGVTLQALTLAFDDVFQLSAWLFFAAVFIIPFCRGGAMTQQGPGAALVH